MMDPPVPPARDGVRYVRLSDEGDMRRWDAFASAHPEGTPFHLSGWLKAISETYAMVPWLATLSDSAGKITALVPFFRLRRLLAGYRLVSLPFSDFCFPLGIGRASVDRLLTALILEPNLKAESIEIRGPLEMSAGFSPCHYYKRHILQLGSDPQEVWKSVDRRTIQYNIRKARREGVEIIEDNSSNGITEFFRLYVLTRKKHGIPHQPAGFFQAVVRNMANCSKISLLLAIYRSKTIAAGLFMSLNRKIYYKYNVSDPDFLVRTVPNHLLTWTAIERACLGGYEHFDFGRTAPDNSGLMRYKKMWGAEVHDLPYFYHPANAAAPSAMESGVLFRMAKGIWRCLPEPIISRLSPLVLQYLA